MEQLQRGVEKLQPRHKDYALHDSQHFFLLLLFLGSVRFFYDLKNVFYAQQGSIYLIKNTVKTIIYK